MRTGWVGVMALAAVSVVPSACLAQQSWRYERQRDSYSVGYDRGYDAGSRHGRVDGHRFDRYHIDVRKSDYGYRGSYGTRSRYTDGFRRGYERGYRRAFDAERRDHRHRGHRCYVGKTDRHDWDWDEDDRRWERDRDRRRY